MLVTLGNPLPVGLPACAQDWTIVGDKVASALLAYASKLSGIGGFEEAWGHQEESGEQCCKWDPVFHSSIGFVFAVEKSQ